MKGKILTMDNLKKKNMMGVVRANMTRESIDHLFFILGVLDIFVLSTMSEVGNAKVSV